MHGHIHVFGLKQTVETRVRGSSFCFTTLVENIQFGFLAEEDSSQRRLASESDMKKKRGKVSDGAPAEHKDGLQERLLVHPTALSRGTEVWPDYYTRPVVKSYLKIKNKTKYFRITELLI
jgi:hypothetical protein